MNILECYTCLFTCEAIKKQHAHHTHNRNDTWNGWRIISNVEIVQIPLHSHHPAPKKIVQTFVHHTQTATYERKMMENFPRTKDKSFQPGLIRLDVIFQKKYETWHYKFKQMLMLYSSWLIERILISKYMRITRICVYLLYAYITSPCVAIVILYLRNNVHWSCRKCDWKRRVNVHWYMVCMFLVRSTKKPFTRRMDNEKSNVNFGALA